MIKKIAAAPYLAWIVLFTLVPILMLFSFAFLTTDGFTTEYLQKVFDPIYLSVISRSLWIALESTVICILVGYPMAMILSKIKPKHRNLAVMLFIIQMWMNFLLRTYAWMTILGKNGVLNGILSLFGVPTQQFLYSEGAVLLGMVYNFLPFMVLPIYTVLMKMDKNLIEAAEDLGADKYKVFFRVILPLSLPGIVSGVAMVFMPAVSTFVISNLLYGGQYMLVGNLIEQQYLIVNDWNFGSAVSVVLMIIILLFMAVMNKVGGEDSSEKGAGLF